MRLFAATTPTANRNAAIAVDFVADIFPLAVGTVQPALDIVIGHDNAMYRRLVLGVPEVFPEIRIYVYLSSYVNV